MEVQLAFICNNLSGFSEVTAFDLSSNRVKILSSMVKRSQARCCRVVRGDFTNVDTDDYKKVEYILVDPSCSGSGEAYSAMCHLISTISKQLSYGYATAF